MAQAARQSFASILVCGICIGTLLAACGPLIIPAAAPPAPTISPASAVPTDCLPGNHLNRLETGGTARQYWIYVPGSYRPGKPVPLVLGFHGNTGHADQFEAYTGFVPVADKTGFILVYPQGAGNPPSWDVWQGSKDIQFVSDLIDRLESTCSIDPARVYATGHSLGGGMVNRLACDLSDRIAAIGSVSGAYVNAEPCIPAQPVAVVATHGTADTDVWYGALPPDGGPPASHVQMNTPIPQWAWTWGQRNGCDKQSKAFFQKGPVSAQRWADCREGADVILYTIQGGQHSWPATTPDFDPAQLIWDFFAAHPRR